MNRILLRAGLCNRQQLARNFTSMRPAFYRYFSTGIKGVSGNSETIIEDQYFYNPTKSIDIRGGTFTVFDNTKASEGQYVSPYEVKETITKNTIGIIVSMVIEHSLIPMYFIPSTYFAINMLYRVSQYMTRAVNQVVLLKCGTKVQVTFKLGGSETWNINDISKNIDEKALVETFAEPYLFPITVKNKGTYYLYGHGHSAIKDGEIFRAIINGRSISLD
ncbi:unnamed protein product [Moneuplotes crassus]|uniref:Uncharacterized protein n=1 Tax=Euplotes crassus TaxID=5936 RepID=A0AAD2D4E6_EUPCR|nr:unnamed protein product [Moneuplotes crassus]